ncbi:MAG: hypothetical protein FJ290_06740 [Planctomycetes bacterium]|nr:hypothetical protein [Planctomycetota bacterium]
MKGPLTQCRLRWLSRGGGRRDWGVGLRGERRVLRGGSWNNNPRNLRSANRNRNHPENRNNNAGFRVVLSAAPLSPRASAPGREARGSGRTWGSRSRPRVGEPSAFVVPPLGGLLRS